MGEAIVADLAGGLLGKLVSLAAEEVVQAWNFHEDLDTLHQRMESVGALLYDAHTKNLIMSTAKNWFDKLEAVANVANVFMDELAYEVTRRKAENRHKSLDFFIPTKNTLLYRLKVAHKIKSIQASFDEIFKSAVDLGLQPVAYLRSTVQDRDIRSTPSYEDKSIIVGRDEDVSYLVQTVCKKHEEDLEVIVVAGMGGQGKTTLARMVFNSDNVITMFPDQRMWITVSDDFDFIKILNQMVESLTLTNLGLTNPQALTRKLQESLKGKKFLLILDDVWNEESVKWDNLTNSLLEIGGDKGSCILVTTRKQEVIDAMRSCVSYWLEILTEDESYELFKKIAFSDGGVLETEAFATIGRSMVKRCGGLPLAIKALAGLLYSKKSEQEWLEIQCSETWESKSVLPSLKLSYDNLPSLSLKQCFAYCSIMPKNSFIYKDELIQIWLALGFLLPPRRSIALTEDIGSKYFKILLGNSLLQDEEKDECGNIIRCKMHDLVHDLALEVSKHHSVSVKAGEELSHDCKAVYMRLDNGVSTIKPTILKRAFERVQVLYAGADILLHVLPYLTHLTVLVLNADDNQVAQELPFSLRKMKYLKHLDISHYKLPTDITELYNLQTLRVGDLDEIPKRFSNLINLRHLYIRNNYGKKCMFNGIERLISLQTLPYFVVSKNQNCLVGQLGGLKHLSGEIRLYGLYEVANIEEARKAKLCEKSSIQCLQLNWRNTEFGHEDSQHNDEDGSNEDEMEDKEYNDQDVMEGLEPHPNLKTLMIVGFRGKKFASWITVMLNLVKLTLRNCNRCEVLPPLSHLPKLREIVIEGMRNLRVVGDVFCGGQSVFPQLERLNIENCPRLRKILPSCTGVSSQSEFPKLEILKITNCPRLRTIPKSYFPSLKNLVITDLESDMMLGTMSRYVSSLTSLSLLRIGD
nr:PREDICTED: putative disease resistance protein RGA3 [Daucus carota subsp. sativus]XP_017216404.1 PREDICTED: putative disease resistance protein RGA3 [Daucus carota subsp. sativus]